jgi:cysteine desulfurase/selenocysteine lyase
MSIALTHKDFDVKKWRKDFPILQRQVNGNTLIYFDNAASAQKPKAVIDEISTIYSNEYSNIHRGVHYLSQALTEKYENARSTVSNFINSKNTCQVIFTKGTTNAINLVAYSWGRKNIKSGDEIIITTMEHHSNIVPWQMLCEEKQAKLVVAPIDSDGNLIIDELYKCMHSKVKLLALAHVSNTLGTINPIKEIINEAHKHGIIVLVDGAQAVPHNKVDVQDLNCDFYAFSGHKLFGPSGIGVLYGKENLLNDMPPFEGGGDMIQSVSFEKTTYNDLPFKFEAGTPHISGAIALCTAIQYVSQIGMQNIAEYEQQLLHYATAKLSEIEGMRFFGQSKNKAAVISFLVNQVHPYDLGTLLDQMGIAVRTGHHCTEPLMQWFKIPGTVRASFAFYNTFDEIDVFVAALKKALKIVG